MAHHLGHMVLKMAYFVSLDSSSALDGRLGLSPPERSRGCRACIGDTVSSHYGLYNREGLVFCHAYTIASWRAGVRVQ